MNFSPTNSSLSFHNRSASSALVAHGLTGSTHGPVTWQSVRYLPLSGALNRAGQDSYQQDQDQELHRHGPRRLSPMVSGPAPSSLLGHPSRGREQLSCQSDIKIEKPQKVKGTFRAPRSSRPDLREGKVVGKIREGHPMVQTELKKVPGRKPSQPERRSWAYSPYWFAPVKGIYCIPNHSDHITAEQKIQAPSTSKLQSRNLIPLSRCSSLAMITILGLFAAST